MSDDLYQSDDSSIAEKEKEKTTTKTIEEKVSPEVFDSSTYDSMTEIKESATMDENDTKEVLADTEKLESIYPETTRIETTDNNNNNNNNNTNANIPSVNPTIEGHASALKQSRENENKGSSRQNIKKKEVVRFTALSKQLDNQSSQINKIIQILQPVQKQFKSIERQSELIKQIQFQLKQLQKLVLQFQKGIRITKKENNKKKNKKKNKKR
jgi:hypothetical protein